MSRNAIPSLNILTNDEKNGQAKVDPNEHKPFTERHLTASWRFQNIIRSLYVGCFISVILHPLRRQLVDRTIIGRVLGNRTQRWRRSTTHFYCVWIRCNSRNLFWWRCDSHSCVRFSFLRRRHCIIRLGWWRRAAASDEKDRCYY